MRRILSTSRVEDRAMKATAALMLVLSFAALAQSCAQFVRTDALSSFVARARCALSLDCDR